MEDAEGDICEYLKRYLNKNARYSERKRLAKQMLECRRWMKFDPRFHTSGHDFVSILIWYVSQHKGFRAFARQTEEMVENGLFACLELQDLSAEVLFQQLLARVES
jgi:hypothetical protein